MKKGRRGRARPEPASLRRRLLAWYDVYRRPLPWRSGRDPYRIWIAEVMLIQTQVETVLPYYRRFLDRYPDVQALASSRLDDVLKLWEGLGYYARARNLHQAAQTVVEDHGGLIPVDDEQLRALPGVGPYVSAAIRAIAFDEPVLAIDGNLRRVLSRVFDVSATDTWLQHSLRDLVEDRPGDVNQALMDLGAGVCTPRGPRCTHCPLSRICLSRQRGTVDRRPRPRPARKRPHYDIAVGVIWRDDAILIAKRRPEGLLGGLWEFPGGKPAHGESLEGAVVREVNEELDIRVEACGKITEVEHAYSHFEITLHAFHCRYRSGTPKPLGCQDFAWVAPEELDSYAFPAANRRVLELLTQARSDVPR